MAETDLTEPATIDRDMMLVGLTAIGIRLYADSGEALPDSILAAERVVFAHQFDPIWRELTNDDHRWLREKLDEENDRDGAFGRMVADYDLRSRGNVPGKPMTNPERDSMGTRADPVGRTSASKARKSPKRDRAEARSSRP
jgi:hypothetical protein